MMYVARTHYDSHMNTGHSVWPDYLIDGGKWEGEHTPYEFWDHFTTYGNIPCTD